MGSATRLAPTRPTMKHNNQIHSVRKFRKYWQRYVKTWFNQPARKKSRRDARHKKAAAIAPRPVAGCVRPLVHPPTVKYNSKTRIGRGFSVAEIKGAKLSKLEAKSLGISVDYRRRNKSVEGKQLNEQRLREYSEMKEANVARTLKAAWNDARLCGFREKRAAERAEKAAQEALKKSK